MSRQVVCIKDIELIKYDDDGYSTEKYSIIPKGSVFNWDEENTHRIIGGEIRLENNETWLELTGEDFKEYFREVRDV